MFSPRLLSHVLGSQDGQFARLGTHTSRIPSKWWRTIRSRDKRHIQALLNELNAIKQQQFTIGSSQSVDTSSSGVRMRAKAETSTWPSNTFCGVDYTRAICFLVLSTEEPDSTSATSSVSSGEARGNHTNGPIPRASTSPPQPNLFDVRQALLEELRLFPQHEAARSLLARVNAFIHPYMLSTTPEALSATSSPQNNNTAVDAPSAMVPSSLFSLLHAGLADYTMLSRGRLYRLFHSVLSLYAGEWAAVQAGGEDGEFYPPLHRLPIVECGTAGGGSAVLMAVVADQVERQLAALGRASSTIPYVSSPHCSPTSAPLHTKRLIFCLDTFSGMPPPSPTRDALYSGRSNEDAGEVEIGGPQFHPQEHTSAVGDIRHGKEVRAGTEKQQEGCMAMHTHWSTGTCSSPAESVMQLAAKWNVADRIVVIPGRFEATIPADLLPRLRQGPALPSPSASSVHLNHKAAVSLPSPATRGVEGMNTSPPALSLGEQPLLGFLHVDADWYSSTKYVLEQLLPLLPNTTTLRTTNTTKGDGCRTLNQNVARNTQGKYYAAVQVDDYCYWQGAHDAVNEVLTEWRQKCGLMLDITLVDNNAAYFEWK